LIYWKFAIDLKNFQGFTIIYRTLVYIYRYSTLRAYRRIYLLVILLYELIIEYKTIIFYDQSPRDGFY